MSLEPAQETNPTLSKEFSSTSTAPTEVKPGAEITTATGDAKAKITASVVKAPPEIVKAKTTASEIPTASKAKTTEKAKTADKAKAADKSKAAAEITSASKITTAATVPTAASDTTAIKAKIAEKAKTVEKAKAAKTKTTAEQVKTAAAVTTADKSKKEKHVVEENTNQSGKVQNEPIKIEEKANEPDVPDIPEMEDSPDDESNDACLISID